MIGILAREVRWGGIFIGPVSPVSIRCVTKFVRPNSASVRATTSRYDRTSSASLSLSVPVTPGAAKSKIFSMSSSKWRLACTCRSIDPFSLVAQTSWSSSYSWPLSSESVGDWLGCQTPLVAAEFVSGGSGDDEDPVGTRRLARDRNAKGQSTLLAILSTSCRNESPRSTGIASRIAIL